MKKSEVAELLVFIAAFDNRIIGPPNVEAWYLLDVCQRNTLETLKAAVVKHFNMPSDERGNSPYLDPHQLKTMVRLVRVDQRRANARLRAQVLAEVSQALHKAGASYPEIEAARQNLLRDVERVEEQGGDPIDVRAFLESQRPDGTAAIESGDA